MPRQPQPLTRRRAPDAKPDAPPADEPAPFWRRKTLAQMSRAEWESLCDGCGKCCLLKLEDADSGEVSYTDVACKLLDLDSCRCTRYAERKKHVPDCIKLSVKLVDKLRWMPSTCYRLVAEGKDLPWWHPLVSGDPETVHKAGISVRSRALSENEVAADDLEDRVVRWPE